MTQTQMLQSINAISLKLNDVTAKLNEVIKMLHDENAANIDYVAMMTNVDLSSEDE